MKRILSLLMAVTFLTLSLLLLTSCGKVAGKTYVFDKAVCKWDDDATAKDKADFAKLFGTLSGDDTVTEKNVLKKYKNWLEDLNKDKSYTFKEDGSLGNSITGTWFKSDDNILIKYVGATTEELDVRLFKLVKDVDTYDVIDAELFFKKQ